jgi:hypothetical protein
VALKRRETAELLTEELRRLDIDETYEEVLRHITDQDLSAIAVVAPVLPKPATIVVEAKADQGPMSSDSGAAGTAGATASSASSAPSPAASAAQAPKPAAKPGKKAPDQGAEP